MFGRKCNVKNCTSSRVQTKDRRISLFPIPCSAEMRLTWLRLTGEENLLQAPPQEVFSLARICEVHFHSSDFVLKQGGDKPKKLLRAGAVPSIFSSGHEPIPGNALLEWLNRYPKNEAENSLTCSEVKHQILDNLTKKFTSMPQSQAPHVAGCKITKELVRTLQRNIKQSYVTDQKVALEITNVNHRVQPEPIKQSHVSNSLPQRFGAERNGTKRIMLPGVNPQLSLPKPVSVNGKIFFLQLEKLPKKATASSSVAPPSMPPLVPTSVPPLMPALVPSFVLSSTNSQSVEKKVQEEQDVPKESSNHIDLVSSSIYLQVKQEVPNISVNHFDEVTNLECTKQEVLKETVNQVNHVSNHINSQVQQEIPKSTKSSTDSSANCNYSNVQQVVRKEALSLIGQTRSIVYPESQPGMAKEALVHIDVVRGNIYTEAQQYLQKKSLSSAQSFSNRKYYSKGRKIQPHSNTRTCNKLYLDNIRVDKPDSLSVPPIDEPMDEDGSQDADDIRMGSPDSFSMLPLDVPDLDMIDDLSSDGTEFRIDTPDSIMDEPDLQMMEDLDSANFRNETPDLMLTMDDPEIPMLEDLNPASGQSKPSVVRNIDNSNDRREVNIVTVLEGSVKQSPNILNDIQRELSTLLGTVSKMDVQMFEELSSANEPTKTFDTSMIAQAEKMSNSGGAATANLVNGKSTVSQASLSPSITTLNDLQRPLSNFSATLSKIDVQVFDDVLKSVGMQYKAFEASSRPQGDAYLHTSRQKDSNFRNMETATTLSLSNSPTKTLAAVQRMSYNLSGTSKINAQMLQDNRSVGLVPKSLLGSAQLRTEAVPNAQQFDDLNSVDSKTTTSKSFLELSIVPDEVQRPMSNRSGTLTLVNAQMLQNLRSPSLSSKILESSRTLPKATTCKDSESAKTGSLEISPNPSLKALIHIQRPPITPVETEPKVEPRIQLTNQAAGQEVMLLQLNELPKPLSSSLLSRMKCKNNKDLHSGTSTVTASINKSHRAGMKFQLERPGKENQRSSSSPTEIVQPIAGFIPKASSTDRKSSFPEGKRCEENNKNSMSPMLTAAIVCNQKEPSQQSVKIPNGLHLNSPNSLEMLIEKSVKLPLRDVQRIEGKPNTSGDKLCEEKVIDVRPALPIEITNSQTGSVVQAAQVVNGCLEVPLDTSEIMFEKSINPSCTINQLKRKSSDAERCSANGGYASEGSLCNLVTPDLPLSTNDENGLVRDPPVLPREEQDLLVAVQQKIHKADLQRDRISNPQSLNTILKRLRDIIHKQDLIISRTRRNIPALTVNKLRQRIQCLEILLRRVLLEKCVSTDLERTINITLEASKKYCPTSGTKK